MQSAKYQPLCSGPNVLITHLGRLTHICVRKLTTIGSDNGLSPGRRQTIIWTNAGIFLIGHLWTKFSETLIEFYTFYFKKMYVKMSSGIWRPSCLSLNVLKRCCEERLLGTDCGLWTANLEPILKQYWPSIIYRQLASWLANTRCDVLIGCSLF